MASFLNIFISSLPFVETSPLIRVQIIASASELSIQGNDAFFSIKDQTGFESTIRASTLQVTPLENTLRINSKRFPVGSVTVSNRSLHYRIGDRTFSGELVLIPKFDKTVSVVNHLPLETYLVGIIAAEVSASWPKETLKAQAVAARTYALAAMQRAQRMHVIPPYDVKSTVLDQVYAGTHTETEVASQAALATKGKVLTRHGDIFLTYYHSSCGGQTEHFHNVWKGDEVYASVVDRFCARNPTLTWEYRVPLNTFTKTLRQKGIPLKKIISLETTQLPDSPRNDQLLITDNEGLHMISATDLRMFFGYNNIKSTWFNAGIEHQEAVFAGRGYGHGVGMCQWGAKGMAEEGFKYTDILKFYYPDAEITAAY